jgi:hypothetical protein
MPRTRSNRRTRRQRGGALTPLSWASLSKNSDGELAKSSWGAGGDDAAWNAADTDGNNALSKSEYEAVQQGGRRTRRRRRRGKRGGNLSALAGEAAVPLGLLGAYAAYKKFGKKGRKKSRKKSRRGRKKRRKSRR